MNIIIQIQEWFRNTPAITDKLASLGVDLPGIEAFRDTPQFEVEVLKETEKAMYINIVKSFDSILKNKKLWIPKSVITIIQEK